ncbi:MAG TPA: hypothetical protein VLI71_15245 [Gammaproteobacteria bacterium]|nr:hypothetical protein [Gammaproteobacteria bacterium]
MPRAHAPTVLCKTLVLLVVVALAACDAGSGGATGVTPEGASAVPALDDFTGVWIGVGTFEDPEGPAPYSNTLWPEDPPFTEWGAAESKRLMEPEAFTPCSPTGPVFAMWEIGLFPFQVAQSPGQLVIVRETGGMPRRIYTDGRDHPPPDEIVPTWMGHSIARWEDDTLVIDTVGTNGRARAMNGVGSNAIVSADDFKPRLPASDQLHLIERWRLLADGQILEDELTIIDPKTYTEPIVVKHVFQRRPDIEMLEYSCTENARTADETLSR